MPTYRHPTTVTADQIDVLGHLNNAAYLAIFEAARWAVLTETGVPFERLVQYGVSPVILEVNLKFRREVRLGEEIVVETRFTRTGPRRFLAHQRMVDAAGKLRASAELVGSFFDVVNRRITDPPPPLLEAIGLVEPVEPPPAGQGLGGVFLYARDRDALASWYTRLLGFTFTQWGDSLGVELPSADLAPAGRTATTTFAIFPAAGPLPETRTARLNFRVSDLDSLVDRLESAGVRVVRGPEDYGRFASTWDPEGNPVELWEPPRLER